MTARLIGLIVVACCAGLATPGARTPAHAGERVDITATDGVQLVGELDGTAGPGVVLADREGSAALVAALVAAGFRTLRFDFRAGDGADAAATERDLEGAYRYLLGRKIRTVFLLGSGSSSRAAHRLAARLPVAGVVTIAPSAAATALGATTSEPNVPTLVVPTLDDAAALSTVVSFLRQPKRPPVN